MHLSNDTGVTKRDHLNENKDVVRKVNYMKSNVDATTNKNSIETTNKNQKR